VIKFVRRQFIVPVPVLENSRYFAWVFEEISYSGVPRTFYSMGMKSFFAGGESK
jgi:hypothetical protein